MKHLFSDRRNGEMVCINLIGRKNAERKDIESTINAASLRPFTNTATIICSGIHIFHLYVNSVC